MGQIRLMGQIRPNKPNKPNGPNKTDEPDKAGREVLIAAGMGRRLPYPAACYPFNFYLFTFLPFLPFIFSRCFLFVVECHSDGVLGQFLYLAAGEEGAYAGLVLLDFRFGLEEDVHRLDVAVGGEVLRRGGGLG